MDNKYDLIIIGAGPGGYVAAVKAAKSGMNVAVIEKSELGGTCLNRGCIPTKSLIHAAELYNEMKECEKFGITSDNVNYDINKMFQYKDDIVQKLRNGIAQLFKSNKITLIKGSAKIFSQNIVKVTTEDEVMEIQAKKILIATGSQPVIPKITGCDLPQVITSDELLTNPNINTDDLIIIGGGVISVEFAGIFSSLGKKVTIIEAMPRLLPNMDKEISQNLKMILKKRNVNIHTGAFVESISKQGSSLICTFKEKDKIQSIEGSSVLLAIGRKCSIDSLFDKFVNVETENGRIVVNEDFETTVKGIYAIGDIIKGIQLAHVASAQGIAAVEKMNSITPEVNLDIIPSCVYTNPEIASVGMTEAEALEKGIEVVVGKTITSSNGKSMIEYAERGFMKIICDKESHIILGAQLMCLKATDMIGELATAIANKMTSNDLIKAMRAHPTVNEALADAVQMAVEKCR